MNPQEQIFNPSQEKNVDNAVTELNEVQLDVPEVISNSETNSVNLQSDILPKQKAPTGQNTTYEATENAQAKTSDNSAPASFPEFAADEDLIEPEWVAKTEKVISATAGNPHAQEEAIEELQIDYMKKRYGREVSGHGPE